MVNQSSKDPKLMKTPCNHKYHDKCLKEWMNIKKECPQCRKPLPPYEWTVFLSFELYFNLLFGYLVIVKGKWTNLKFYKPSSFDNKLSLDSFCSHDNIRKSYWVTSCTISLQWECLVVGSNRMNLSQSEWNKMLLVWNIDCTVCQKSYLTLIQVTIHQLIGSLC